MSLQTKVIIIGGGVGGLALGQGLKKAGIPFIICERDISRDYRPQGYRLRISNEGHDALEKLLPSNVWELCNKVIITSKLKFTKIDALSGQVIPMERTPPNHGDPNKPNTADRHVFRALLMYGLENDIKFGWEYQEHQLTNEGGVKVIFKNGESIEGNVLIGADGTNSKVRLAEVPNHNLLDTEGRAIFGKTLLTSELLSKFPSDALENTTLITQADPLITLFLEPVVFTHDLATSGGKIPRPHDYVYWVLVTNKSSLQLTDTELSQLSKDELKKYALQLTESWQPSIRSLIDLSQPEQSSFIRISSFSPLLPEWKTECLTFVGDSIHAMTPIGLGANLALKDASILCNYLVSNGINNESLRKYEEEMRIYSGETIKQSRMGGFSLFRQPELEKCKYIQ